MSAPELEKQRAGVAGRVAIVTGSGGGIGAAIAERLAADGARVVINDVVPDRAEQQAAAIRETGADAMAVGASVADPADVRSMFEEAAGRWGSVDIVVNNAGIEGDAGILKVTPERWQKVLDVNLTGVFLGCQLAAEYMRAANYGRIVNIASRAWLGWWAQSTYAASKGGVVSLTRALAVELARSNVTVNCVAPGLVETPMLAAAPPDVVAKLLVAQPTRSIGTASDIAYLVRALVDERARAVTGQIVYACGGKSIFAMPAR